MKCLGAFVAKELAGYAIIEAHTGDVPQLAIMAGHRGSGVATALLRALAKQTNNNMLRFANIEATYAPFKRFMERTNQKKGPGQLEMALPL